MVQPEGLKTDAPLIWSTGTGTSGWALFNAAIAGDLPAIRELLAKDPDLVRCHFDYRTPIYFAVRENQVEVAAYLLEHGADPASLAVGDSLLQITRDRGYVEMEKLLVSFLADKYNSSPKGDAVGNAIRQYNLRQARALLDAAPELLHVGDQTGNQPIHWAVMTRQIEAIDELLARGADINAKRFDGGRPIHLSNGDYSYRGWRDVPESVKATPEEVLAHVIERGVYIDIWTACHRGDLERVRELLDENPALVNTNSDYKSYYLGCGSPIRNAAAHGHMEIVKLLLERGADPNLPEEGIAPHGHALYSAAANGFYDLAVLLLEHGANPNAAVESSADCLSRAISNNDQPMIDLLVSHGAVRAVEISAYYGDVKDAEARFAANPELANDPGALANAASEGQDEYARLMLRYQPDLAKRIAVVAKNPELTEYLFQQGMDPNHANWLGVTRLHEFAERGALERARVFLDHGADPNLRDDDLRSTPLGWAAKFGRSEMVELLLSRGAQPHLPDDPPWATPYAWATRRGHMQIAQRLRQFEPAGEPPNPADAFIEAACVPLDSGHGSGTLEAAEAILTAHPDVAGSSIHAAAILGDDEAVRRFVALDPHNATVKGGPRGWDALTHLCFSRYLRLDPAKSAGFVRAAEVLLDFGASANTGFYSPGHQPTPEFECVLYGAAGVAHHPELTQLLLERGADPNDGEVAYHSPEWFDDRAMRLVVETGKLTPWSLTMMVHRKLDWHHYDGVKWLLEQGAEASLHHALGRCNALKFFELLLDRDADPNRSSADGHSAFDTAARMGRGDVLELFEQRGFSAKFEPPYALLAACARGDGARARAILAEEPTLAARLKPHHGTLLAEFAGAGNTAGVGVLLDLGFDVATRASLKWRPSETALHVAVWRERRATVQLLLDRGAPLEALDDRGETPLSLAVRAMVNRDEWTPHQTTEIIEALLRAGAQPALVKRFPSGSAEADALLRSYGRED